MKISIDESMTAPAPPIASIMPTYNNRYINHQSQHQLSITMPTIPHNHSTNQQSHYVLVFNRKTQPFQSKHQPYNYSTKHLTTTPNNAKHSTNQGPHLRKAGRGDGFLVELSEQLGNLRPQLGPHGPRHLVHAHADNGTIFATTALSGKGTMTY